MAIANLTFLLPEDHRLFCTMLAGEKFGEALLKIREEVRKVYKYKEMSEESMENVELIYTAVCDIVSESGVNDLPDRE